MASITGIALVTGLIVFLIGAGGWRLAYERPLVEALRVIHVDRRRRAWIHVWMVAAMLVTPAGLAGLVFVPDQPVGAGLAAMALIVYTLGAVCWIASLVFRLTVVPWAAARTVEDGVMPDGFSALDAWAGYLYVVHMAASYVAFAVLGAAVLAGTDLPGWLGWLGVGWGGAFLVGFVATRFSGPFNPPFWAHAYTGLIGVVLLVS
jgi:hypothetical protein